MNFSALAFDPGGATGWALYQRGFISSGTIWEEEHHADIRQLIQRFEPSLVITESFEFRQSQASHKERRGLNLVSREYIGVMKLICNDLEIPLIQQMPAHAMSRITDDKLKRLEYFFTPAHPHRHEHDALRHLFFYLCFKEKDPKWLSRLKTS